METETRKNLQRGSKGRFKICSRYLLALTIIVFCLALLCLLFKYLSDQLLIHIDFVIVFLFWLPASIVIISFFLVFFVREDIKKITTIIIMNTVSMLICLMIIKLSFTNNCPC